MSMFSRELIGDRLRKRFTQQIAIVIIALIVIRADRVDAHPIHVQRGSVSFKDNQMTVRFQVSGHDAEHMNSTVDAASRDLIRCLYVFDEHGEALSAKTTTINDDGCAIEFKLGDEQRFVTFQQRIGPETIVRNRMIELELVRTESADSSTVRLSAGGNAETIGVRHAELPEESKRVDRFHELVVFVTPNEEHVELELHVPAPLLESWIPFDRAKEDSIRATEIERNTDAITKWFLERLTPTESGGERALRVEQVALLDPSIPRLPHESAPAVESQSARPKETIVGYWCARIVVKAIIEHPTGAQLDLNCKIFNSKVMTAKAAIINGGNVTWTTLSTYAPHLRVKGAM